METQQVNALAATRMTAKMKQELQNSRRDQMAMHGSSNYSHRFEELAPNLIWGLKYGPLFPRTTLVDTDSRLRAQTKVPWF